MEKITVFDTTLRDGEQSPGASLNIDEKLEIAKQLEKLGVDIIEAGFPASSEGELEAVKKIAENVKKPIICVLSRCKKEDIDKSYEALKNTEKRKIHLFIGTSDVHIKDKLGKTKEQVIEIAKESVSYAKSFFNDVEFSPEDAARTDLDYMIDVVKVAINAGATTINVPDTVGYSQPAEYGNRIKMVFEKLGKLIKEKGVVISAHCHDDLGLAVANSLEGIKSGARQVECTINGIGERAGNCALEEVIMNLKTRKDFFNQVYTDIDTKELYKTSCMVAQLTGISVQRNKAIIGANAFAHEAGIHQHGVLKNRLTYEIMKPEDIGWMGECIVIGKHSGKHAIESLLNKNKLAATEEQIKQITERVKQIADEKKNVEENDILNLIKEVLKS